ncbi:MAG: ISAzo13 family transposase [Acidobacteria bacterium]|nr:ISAzo13 family transposase [Acidobacteriota bacterium]
MLGKEERAEDEKKEATIAELTSWILEYVEQNTAGSPTDETIKWTHLRHCDIASHLQKGYQEEVGTDCIKRILYENGYRKRKPAKQLATGESPNRSEQFRIIGFLLALFRLMSENPIISIDTKKKEILGELTRNEEVLTKGDEPVSVFDHDYPHLGTGKAIPHGIYDLKLNEGYLSLGNSHETAEFVVDNLEWWWETYGKYEYRKAARILILCDSGGANGHRHHLFKKCLQELARKINKKLVIAHYPPYCSKYNPIERRLFAQVHRTIKATILTDLEQVKTLMEKTATKTGLSVEVRINDKNYPLKQPSLAEEVDEKRILRHPTLPKLSYTILP